jgi:hypothetical protein
VRGEWEHFWGHSEESDALGWKSEGTGINRGRCQILTLPSFHCITLSKSSTFFCPSDLTHSIPCFFMDSILKYGKSAWTREEWA